MHFIPAKYRRLLSVLGVAAALIFFLGAESGSVDTDGDGYPETPILISTSVPVAHCSRLAPTSRPLRILRVSVLPAVVIRAPHHEGAESAFPVGRSALSSFCLLRC